MHSLLFFCIVLSFLSVAQCASTADAKKSYAVKVANGYTIVARDSTGKNITTGGETFYALAAAGDPQMYYAHSAAASSHLPANPPSAVVGIPDLDECQNSTDAWCPSDLNDTEWLSVAFSTAVVPLYIAIHESDNAPFVQNVTISYGTLRYQLVDFVDDADCPGGDIYTPQIDPQVIMLVNNINITVDGYGDHPEVDAIGMYGYAATNLAVVDNGDGTYFVKTVTTTAPQLFITFEGQNISGSPFALKNLTSSCSNPTPVNISSSEVANLQHGSLNSGVFCNNTLHNVSGIWYTINGTGESVSFETCDPNIDTVISVFAGSCGGLTCIANSFTTDYCNCQGYPESDGGYGGGIAYFSTEVGKQYYIFVQERDTTYNTEGTTEFSVMVDPVVLPNNDFCNVSVLVTEEPINGTLIFATSSPVIVVGYNATNFTENGVWNKVQGTSQPVTISTCDSVFKPKLRVFTGSCGALRVVDYNISDTECDGDGEIIVFDTELGSTYYILVETEDGGCADTQYSDYQIAIVPPPACPFMTVTYLGNPISPVASSITVQGPSVFDSVEEESSFGSSSDSDNDRPEPILHCTYAVSGYGMLSQLSFNTPFHIFNESVEIAVSDACGGSIAAIHSYTESTYPVYSTTGFKIDVFVAQRFTNVSKFYLNATITQSGGSGAQVPPENAWSTWTSPQTQCNFSYPEVAGIYTTASSDNVTLMNVQYNSDYLTFFVWLYNLVNETSTRLITATPPGTKLPSEGGMPWVDYQYVTHNNKVYVFGGWYVLQGSITGTSNTLDSSQCFFEIDPSDTGVTTQLTPSGDILPGRVGHSMVSYGGYIYIFAGEYADDNYDIYINDFHQVQITGAEFVVTKIKAATALVPSPRFGHSAVVYGNTMYMYGGANAVYAYGDLWAFDFITSTWTVLYNYTRTSTRDVRALDGPAPRWYHTAAVYLDSMLIAGGNTNRQDSGNLWQFNFTSQTWTLLPQSNLGPTSIISSLVLGSSFIIVGNGEGSTFDDVPAMSTYVYSLPSFCQVGDSKPGCVACGAGYYTLDTSISRACQSCPAGTAGTAAVTDSCSACNNGFFQNEVAQQSCIPCFAGFYGNSTGSETIASCLPCPSGFYSNSNGSTNCTACPAGEFCPVASVVAIVSSEFTNYVNSSEAAFQAADFHKYGRVNYKFLWIIAGVIFLWLLISMILMCLKHPLPRFFNFVRNADFLNKTDYQIPGPVMQSRTYMGGFMSMGAALVIIGLLFYIVLTFKYNNDEITISLVSGLSRSSDTTVSRLGVDTKIYGYSGACEAIGENTGACAAGITISQTGFSITGNITCTQVDKSTCRIQWRSDLPTSIFSPSSITIGIYTAPASAYAVFWNISSNSVYDGSDTFVTGYLIPSSPQNVFRGARNDSPSIVQVSVIPTTFSVWRKPDLNRDAITLNFLSRDLGHQAQANSFYTGSVDQGFTVSYEFEIPEFTYQKIVSQKVTPIVAVSNFVALVGGVMAVCRLILGFYFTAKKTGSSRRTPSNEYEPGKSTELSTSM